MDNNRNYSDIPAGADREFGEDAGWKRIQQNTFTRWVNEHLKSSNKQIRSLETDLADGLRLISLIEALSGKRMIKYTKKPTFRSQKLENISMCLEFLGSEEGIKIVNIDSTDIIDCNLKLILGLIWMLILHYSISIPSWDLEGQDTNFDLKLNGRITDNFEIDNLNPSNNKQSSATAPISTSAVSKHEPTPKQKLLSWIQSRMPQIPVTNFTTDWNDGRILGALVDAIAPGLCPDWPDWKSENGLENAQEAMSLAEEWLSVPQLIKPRELINKNIDEMSVMTYLSQFPNAKVRPGAPLRPRIDPGKVRVYGPGVQTSLASDNPPIYAGKRTNFTIDTSTAGRGSINVDVQNQTNPSVGKIPLKIVAQVTSTPQISLYDCEYTPPSKGTYQINVEFAAQKLPNSPYHVCVEDMPLDINKIVLNGPALLQSKLRLGQSTYFDVITEKGAGINGKITSVMTCPTGQQIKLESSRCNSQSPIEFVVENLRNLRNFETEKAKSHEELNKERFSIEPNAIGLHTITVMCDDGKCVKGSPFKLCVEPNIDLSKFLISGRGIQPQGLRVGDKLMFDIHYNGYVDENVDCSIDYIRESLDVKLRNKETGKMVSVCKISPTIESDMHKNAGKKSTLKDLILANVGKPKPIATYSYSVDTEGIYELAINSLNQPLPRTPVDLGIEEACKSNSSILAFGPGLHGGLAGQPCVFTVDTKGQVGALGFAIEGPSQTTIECKDEGNGLAHVTYIPACTGEYSVRILCNERDIPGSPWCAWIGNSNLTNNKTIDIYKKSFELSTENGINQSPTDLKNSTKMNDESFYSRLENMEKAELTGSFMDCYKGQMPFDLNKHYELNVKFSKNTTYSEKNIEKSSTPFFAYLMSCEQQSTQQEMIIEGWPEETTISKSIKFTITPIGLGKNVLYIINPSGVNVCGSPFMFTVKEPSYPDKVSIINTEWLFKECNRNIRTSRLRSLESLDMFIDTSMAGIGNLSIAIENEDKIKVPVQNFPIETNGSDTKSQNNYKNYNNKKLQKAQFKPLLSGPYTINVFYNECHIPGSPYNIYIKPHIDVSAIKILDLEPNVLIGAGTEIIVDTTAMKISELEYYDKFIQEEQQEQSLVKCLIHVPATKKYFEAYVEKQPSNQNHNHKTYGGQYIVYFNPKDEGLYNLDFSFDGVPILPKPYAINAKHGFDASRVKVSGEGLKHGYVVKTDTKDIDNEKSESIEMEKEGCSFIVDTRRAGTGGLGLTIEGPSEAKMHCVDNRDGTCKVTYYPQIAGEYDITVKFEDVHIPGSPFTAHILDEKETLTQRPTENLEENLPLKSQSVVGVPKGLFTFSGSGLLPRNFRAGTIQSFFVNYNAESSRINSEIFTPDDFILAIKNKFTGEILDTKYTIKRIERRNSPNNSRAKTIPKVIISPSPSPIYAGKNINTPEESSFETVENEQLSQIYEVTYHVPNMLENDHIKNAPCRLYDLELLYKGGLGQSMIETFPRTFELLPTVEPDKLIIITHQGQIVNDDNQKFYASIPIALSIDATDAGTAIPTIKVQDSKGHAIRGILRPRGGQNKKTAVHRGDPNYFEETTDLCWLYTFTPHTADIYSIFMKYGACIVPSANPLCIQTHTLGTSEGAIVRENFIQESLEDKRINLTIEDLKISNNYSKNNERTEKTDNIVAKCQNNEQKIYRFKRDQEQCFSVDVSQCLQQFYNNQTYKINTAQENIDTKTHKGSDAVCQKNMALVPRVTCQVVKEHSMDHQTQQSYSYDESCYNLAYDADIVDNMDGTYTVFLAFPECGIYNVETNFGGNRIPGGHFPVLVEEWSNKKNSTTERKIYEEHYLKQVLEYAQYRTVEFNIPFMAEQFTNQQFIKNGHFNTNSFEEGDNLTGILYSVEENISRVIRKSLMDGILYAEVRGPSGKIGLPKVTSNTDGTINLKYHPTEPGLHEIDIRYQKEPVQGSPYQFYVDHIKDSNVTAWGPGLSFGLAGDACNFTVVTKDGEAGGLNVTVEGPSQSDISCHDNKDGTVGVTYVPNRPGDYRVNVKFNGSHIAGSPFTVKISGEGAKRTQMLLGCSNEISLKLVEGGESFDVKRVKTTCTTPSGLEDVCVLRGMPNGYVGVSFTPHEIGPHIIRITQPNGDPITGSPFTVNIKKEDLGDASKVRITGQGVTEGKTMQANLFKVDTKNAGYGGLNVSMEGPSRAEIECIDNHDGTSDFSYIVKQPGEYQLNIKFADNHVQASGVSLTRKTGSPYSVKVTGKGVDVQREVIKKKISAAKETQPGSNCELNILLLDTDPLDLLAQVTFPNGSVELCEIVNQGNNRFSVQFKAQELGLHSISVKYKGKHIQGSPFPFTVGEIVRTDGTGAHKVKAYGPGLEQVEVNQKGEFNINTHEAGEGTLSVGIDGPGKAQITFDNLDNGYSAVEYLCAEAGEYKINILFNDKAIPDSPFTLYVTPPMGEARKITVTGLEDMISGSAVNNKPVTFTVKMNGAKGHLDAKVVNPAGQEDDCYILPSGDDDYLVRFMPKVKGTHYVNIKFNHVHIRHSPFRIRVGKDVEGDPFRVQCSGKGLSVGVLNQPNEFFVNTADSGTSLLHVEIDGPGKTEILSHEDSEGYKFKWTPTVPGNYYITIKYGGHHITGSPFKAIVEGKKGGLVPHSTDRRQTSDLSIETVTKISGSKANEFTLPHFKSDASKVETRGMGLQKAFLNKHNVFMVNCSKAGDGMLMVGIIGYHTPEGRQSPNPSNDNILTSNTFATDSITSLGNSSPFKSGLLPNGHIVNSSSCHTSLINNQKTFSTITNNESDITTEQTEKLALSQFESSSYQSSTNYSVHSSAQTTLSYNENIVPTQISNGIVTSETSSFSKTLSNSISEVYDTKPIYVRHISVTRADKSQSLPNGDLKRYNSESNDDISKFESQNGDTLLDSTFVVNYEIAESGIYFITVLWGNEHIPGSPFRIETF